jgi:hypothetical protein
VTLEVNGRRYVWEAKLANAELAALGAESAARPISRL